MESNYNCRSCTALLTKVLFNMFSVFFMIIVASNDMFYCSLLLGLPEELFRKGGVNYLVFSFVSSGELLTNLHFESFFGVVMHEEEIIAFVRSQGQAADLSNQVINTFNFKLNTELENSLRNSKHDLPQYLTKGIFRLGEHLKWYFISKLLR